MNACQYCHECVHLHGIMLKGGNMANVVSCARVGMQECVASGAVHVPAVGDGMQVLMDGTCMCTCVHPSAVLYIG